MEQVPQAYVYEVSMQEKAVLRNYDQRKAREIMSLLDHLITRVQYNADRMQDSRGLRDELQNLRDSRENLFTYYFSEDKEK